MDTITGQHDRYPTPSASPSPRISPSQLPSFLFTPFFAPPAGMTALTDVELASSFWTLEREFVTHLQRYGNFSDEADRKEWFAILAFHQQEYQRWFDKTGCL